MRLRSANARCGDRRHFPIVLNCAVDEGMIARAMSADESSLALLYFHLHFYLIRKSGEWIHDGSQ